MAGADLQVPTLLRAVWRYQGFIASSIVNEFKSRIARSRLGWAWIILQPLFMAVIFATVLSEVLAARLPGIEGKYAYVVYLLSGMLCWTIFNEIVQRCLSVFIDNASLLKKIQFPRITLPLVVIGSAVVNNLALMLVVLILIPVLGIDVNREWMWLPVLLIETIALATGLGLLLGTLNVFVRDVGQVTSIVLQFWFWMTPIVYPVSIVPDYFKAFIAVNPVADLVMGYHNVLLLGVAPPPGLLSVAAISAGLLAAAWFVFRRASPEIVDAL